MAIQAAVVKNFGIGYSNLTSHDSPVLSHPAYARISFMGHCRLGIRLVLGAAH
jgi:hypothetical protein